MVSTRHSSRRISNFKEHERGVQPLGVLGFEAYDYFTKGIYFVEVEMAIGQCQSAGLSSIEIIGARPGKTVHQDRRIFVAE